MLWEKLALYATKYKLKVNLHFLILGGRLLIRTVQCTETPSFKSPNPVKYNKHT